MVWDLFVLVVWCVRSDQSDLFFLTFGRPHSIWTVCVRLLQTWFRPYAHTIVVEMIFHAYDESYLLVRVPKAYHSQYYALAESIQ